MTASAPGRDGWSAQQARELFFANLRSLHIDPELEQAVRLAERERLRDRAHAPDPRRAGRAGEQQRPGER